MKLNDKNILILGLPRFDSELESTNYTSAKILARNNRVIYVENPHTLRDYWSERHSSKMKRRKGYLSLWSTEVMPTDIPNLSIVIPPVLLSINFLPEGLLYRLALWVNEFLLGWKLNRILKKQNFASYFYINSFNFHYPTLTRYLKPVLKVYHCLDPLIVAFDRRHGLLSERELIVGSDLVICSSRSLYEEKRLLNPHCTFIPNAADIRHSIRSLDDRMPIHPLYASITGPVVGYFGAIERRIDYPLLEATAKQLPDITFLLVGPVQQEYVPDSLVQCPNIIFYGPVPYSELPSVLKGFDVAIIPFKKDEVSRTIFPLKLFEYLGAGKPVVCTDFNLDLAEFSMDTVAYCSTVPTFVAAIRNAASDKSPDSVKKRIDVARNNTWDRRVDEMSASIYGRWASYTPDPSESSLEPSRDGERTGLGLK
ncbi:glycosyltransferase involved in cell wall biosynthesis [Dyadobacter jejuensis]|uniref:Glycosyltransferase involved in cell wall biosynthesis n=1 Tax=Dyadobacter jejuensis TaxID=1082580 RepID=A0A316AGP0_9BACT|nr:glycosyltransferase [Dyadobacter jejuensis]PWJ56791.1 glycosyltransferase involved in cell wall biosynthesis [Dyadobacter jejuensis]